MGTDFERVAVVNRGEAALRFLSALREHNHQHGGRLRGIALYTEPDRGALFVREADESHCLGPAQVGQGAARRNAYTDERLLERALRATGAEAAWTGWGFVSEEASFVERLEGLGLVHIGPSSAAMRQLGDKVRAKRLAEQLGIPVIPWSGEEVSDLEGAARAAARLGYPLLVKARAGGGGRGIRRVERPDQLPEAWRAARVEALRAFGQPGVFLESALDGCRHVEVQVLADARGGTWAVGLRDCSLQRRHQKLVEQAPPVGLSAAEQELLAEQARQLARAAGYRSAGTVEFLFDPRTRLASFLEVNTRLQVEHPVTEATTGLDLVKLQIAIAQGHLLEGEPPAPRGCAIEARLNAEDPECGFAPAPGRLELLRLPTGPGLRIDRGATEGDAVPPDFDPLVAKIVAHGADRGEALARLRRALREAGVIVSGGTTNRAFLLQLLEQPEVVADQVDTGWVERYAASRAGRLQPRADVALLAAAVEVYDRGRERQEARFFQAALRHRPEVEREDGRVVEFRQGDQGYRVQVFQLGPGWYRARVDGARVDLRVEPVSAHERWLTIGGARHRVLSTVEGDQHRVDVDGHAHRFSRDDLGIVRAPSPAVVVGVAVRAGDLVAAGDTLAVLESMKMETAVRSPFAGRVRQVLALANSQVGPGTPLLQLDPLVEGQPPLTERIAFDATAAAAEAGPRARARAHVEGLLRAMLGYDSEPDELGRAVAEYGQLADEADGTEERQPLEDELLAAFADVVSIFRRRGASDDPDLQDPMSSGEYLLIYLATLEAGSGLPASFLERLRRALSHYGVSDLRRSPELREALVRLWKAHAGAERLLPVALTLLERRLRAGTRPGAAAGEGLALLLDRLGEAAENRFPALSDLAREARYRLFDQPHYERARQRVYAVVEERLAALRRGVGGERRRQHLEALVDCPQPLQSLFLGRLAGETSAMREAMLEVLTRRYYRIRELGELRTFALAHHPGLETAYEHGGQRLRLYSTACLEGELEAAVAALAARAGSAGDELLLDLYLWKDGPLGEEEDNARALAERLERVLPARARRAVVALAGPGRGLGMAGLQHFTYRPGDAGLVEDRLYRGFHPMIGKRLRLWRLAQFDIRRLPSAEDVYLFHAVARENPRDERLFALAEVRDVTPLRDPAGRVAQVPHLERMLLECLAGIRAFQSRRRPEERLYWNRVYLDVWPALEIDLGELEALARKMAPATEGLGLDAVYLQASLRSADGALVPRLLRISNPGQTGLEITAESEEGEPLRPLSEYGQKVTRLAQRGLTYPYEIVRLLTPSEGSAHADFPPGRFEEHDLDEQGRLVPVERPYGGNRANVVVGLLGNRTARHPEGLTRVAVFGDPSREMGSLAEPECRRVLAALELAERRGLPVEWYALSAGARISMESGTENMDWISRVLRRLVEFTQRGGEVNVVVCGINVGAQPYWNAEATMLMHTRGILVMTPQSAMVLTGKTALDYSGSVSADDNIGIGGYERVMGPNGQAQYWARDIADACRLLLRHYEHAHVAPGERFPRRAASVDPRDRDVRLAPHGGGPGDFARVGEIFDPQLNPGRKRPFEIRKVMAAVVDQDLAPLERWSAMLDAETAVVWDAHLGGQPVCLLGFESRPLPRLGFVPTDGPEQWTSGTLFPRSSKKVARAINAASGSRPLVVLANLSGFDGSPESMRRLQLEHGAEIGRAVVNFQGPIVFCVVSRYHGGAFVVFSKALHDCMEVSAVEGSYASVIGGAPAAAVVFAREVESRTRKDARVAAAAAALAAAEDPTEKRRLALELASLRESVRSGKLGEVAEEFDRVHSVERALRVGSLDRILPPGELRPYLIDAVERGMRRWLELHP